MRVLRSRNGKVALETDGGNIIIQFLAITSTGPQFDAAERRAFYSEYNTIVKMEVEDALLSFLGAAKRAYYHNSKVIEFLMERLMSKNFSDMTLLELVSVYNKLANSLNKPKRASFNSKADALAALAKLDELSKQPTPAQLKNQGVKIMTKLDENGNEVVEQTVEKKPRGKGIGARAMELILEGKSNQEVIDTIREEIEGANPTPATMAWYRNKLRKDGKLPPSNRGKKEAVAEPEVEETEEDAEV